MSGQENRRRLRGRSLSGGLFAFLVLTALVSTLFPFYWVMATSLKSTGEIQQSVPSLAPRSFFLHWGRFDLESTGAAPSDRNGANKILSDLLEPRRDASVVSYSVDFSRSPGRVEVLFDTRMSSDAQLQAMFAEAGYRVVASEPSRPYPSFSNYEQVFSRQPFGTYLKNSAIVAGTTTALCLLVGSFCAYALARLKFRFRDLLLSLILGVSMFPQIAVVSPLFLVLKKVHLLNTYAALITPYTTFSLPLTIWVLTGFFRDLPLELEEAARVDGCTRIQTFFRVIIPLSAPGVFTCAILVFISAWNEFMFALVFITSKALRTVPVGITMYPGEHTMPWGTIFAAATLVTLPLVIMVFLFQRRIVSGLTMGAVKG